MAPFASNSLASALSVLRMWSVSQVRSRAIRSLNGADPDWILALKALTSTTSCSCSALCPAAELIWYSSISCSSNAK